MFSSILLASLACSVLASTAPRRRYTVDPVNFIRDKNVNDDNTPLTCGKNKIAMGFSCHNKCSDITIRCRDISKWNIQVSDSHSCETRTDGTKMLYGFSKGLQPLCRVIENKGARKTFHRRCVDQVMDLNKNGAVSCASTSQIISGVSIDRANGKVKIQCCQGNDNVKPLTEEQKKRLAINRGRMTRKNTGQRWRR